MKTLHDPFRKQGHLIKVLVSTAGATRPIGLWSILIYGDAPVYSDKRHERVQSNLVRIIMLKSEVSCEPIIHRIGNIKNVPLH